jgi:hypothetical protein
VIKSSGKWRGDFHAIYVLWEPKNNSRWDKNLDALVHLSGKGAGLTLDEGTKLFPKQAGEFKAIHLATDISGKQAERVLDNLDEKREELRERRK